MDMASQPSRRALLALATLVFVAVLGLEVIALPDTGLTWDETAYMGSAQSYGMWFTVLARSLARLQPADAVSDAVLKQYWSQQLADLHPPLGKLAPAISWRLLRTVAGDIIALRLGNAALFAALVALVLIIGERSSGLPAGLFAAAALVAMPRLFFHGRLTALDIPVALAWMLTIWLFRRWALSSRPRLWPAVLWLGLSYGLALGSKNTSLILPGALLLWLALFRRRRESLVLIAGMGVIAVAVFLASWPWLYADLPGRLTEYLQRMTIGHWQISQFYLGQTYDRPPWHYPFVTTLAIVPATLLLMALLGVLRVIVAGRSDPDGWLILLNALTPLVFFGFVSNQVYGSERLYLVVFPFLALLAGFGFDVLWRAAIAARGRSGQLLGGLAALVLLLPGAWGIARMHPYELSYFSEIVGGSRGAERIGLEITYWCETYRAALPFLNAVPEQNASIWTEEDGVLYTYQRAGELRGDLKVGGRVVQAGPLAADYALIQRRPSGYTADMESILRHKTPVFTVSHAGIALAYVYKIQ